MTRWIPKLVALTIAAGLGCSDDGGPTDSEDPDPTPTVAVRSNFFDPSGIEVAVNGTVTWQWNSGGVEHNVTFESGPSSGNRTSGSFARSFDAAGTYSYVCTIHAAEGMTGTVTATTGSTGTGGDSNGDGGTNDPGY